MDHILYVNLSAVHGGAEEYLLEHMETAHQLGFEPVIVLPDRGWLSQAAERHGIHVEVMGTLPETFRTSTAWRQAAPVPINNARLWRLATRHRAVAVVCNSPRSAYHAGLASRAARIPCLVTVHEARRLPYESAVKGRLLSRVSDVTVAVSEAVRDAVLSGAPQIRDRLDVIRNGLDPAQYSVVQASDLASICSDLEPPVLGYVGGVTPIKGVHVLLEAARQLADQNQPFTLLVVGSAQGDPEQLRYQHSLRRFVESHGLQRRVHFLGWREDAWPIIKALDILILPAVEPDAQPRVIIHAMGLGTPVIASDIGGIPEELNAGACGVLVPPGDGTALARAVCDLIRDESRRCELVESARARQAETFNHQQFREGISRVYDRLLSRGDSASRRPIQNAGN